MKNYLILVVGSICFDALASDNEDNLADCLNSISYEDNQIMSQSHKIKEIFWYGINNNNIAKVQEALDAYDSLNSSKNKKKRSLTSFEFLVDDSVDNTDPLQEAIKLQNKTLVRRLIQYDAVVQPIHMKTARNMNVDEEFIAILKDGKKDNHYVKRHNRSLFRS